MNYRINLYLDIFNQKEGHAAHLSEPECVKKLKQTKIQDFYSKPKTDSQNAPIWERIQELDSSESDGDDAERDLLLSQAEERKREKKTVDQLMHDSFNEK